MDVEKVKSMIGFSNTTKHDAYLTEMIPLIVERAKEYCHNDFKDHNGEEALPAGIKIFVAKGCQFNLNKAGLKSQSMGSVSYTFDTNFPASYYKEIQTYRKVRFK
ncbi:phage head-tail connector protein [Jeotgalibacillus campisalis]|uniref:Phage head-tail adapter protein n=1 Tax=Jeotgalibacillus campisalis TaxID=220754 RepID=A0A0C2VNY5_9BACL|nr:phage head-tail connector protein [Jeotgalibacillus campisalis]KIL46161.1 hypothetical protein KR50_28360 [Jeotgalibacillus campisalis]